ncbi:tRNA1(Val) (adenine(37)-N6)-methyltransferase [Hydrogenimonas sp.]
MLFYQPDGGYCFNSDSIFLYDFIAQARPKGRLLDVGGGVGVIGLLLARDFDVAPTLVEKQPLMAELAERNAKINGIEAKVVRSDFLDFDDEVQYDFIISNPPFYHPDVIQSQNAHLNACRYNIHLPIGPFFKKVKRLIAPRGHFVFCYDASQVAELLSQLMAVGLRPERMRFVHPKRERPAKLVMIHARNQSRARCRVEPPFIVFDGDDYGPEATAIFEKARTHTIKCKIS